MSVFCRIDDKHIPLYRVMWVSATPHYCGEEDCVREGSYEIRLEQGESVWASMIERDEMMQRLESWHGDMDVPDDGEVDGDDVDSDGATWLGTDGRQKRRATRVAGYFIC